MGTHGRNADVLVMMTQGVVKGNTVHRRPETERWDRSELKDLRGVPWLLRPREAGDLEHRLYIALPEAMQTLTPACKRWRTKAVTYKKERPGERGRHV